jgi:hypothetical protein
MHRNWLRGSIALLLVLALHTGEPSALPPPPGGGGSGPTLSEKLITDMGQEAFIAANPTNALNLLVAYQTGLEPAKYTPDAKRWIASAGQQPIGMSDPYATFDAAGAAYLSSLSTSDGIRTWKSTDGGANFGPMVPALDRTTVLQLPDGSSHQPCQVPPPLGTAPPIFDFPKINADRNPSSPFVGRLYASVTARYDLDANGTCEVAYGSIIHSMDGGATWTGGRALSPQVIYNIGVGGPQGTVFVITWASGITQLGSNLCPGQSGNGLALYRSTDGGVSFSAPTCIYGPTSGMFVLGGGHVAFHPTNADLVYVAFVARIAALNNTHHIFLIRSSDGGTTWSAPLRVDDASPASDLADHNMPAISIASSGRLDLVWMDRRNAPPPPQTPAFADFYYTWSADGGVSVQPNVRLTPEYSILDTTGNDYVGIVSQGNVARVAHAEDRRNPLNQKEVYVTTITHP